MAAARLRSPLGRAIGLGSAKEGVEHWWLQRVTAVALVPLTLWFVVAVVRLSSADIDAVRDWVGRPLPTQSRTASISALESRTTATTNHRVSGTSATAVTR